MNNKELLIVGIGSSFLCLDISQNIVPPRQEDIATVQANYSLIYSNDSFCFNEDSEDFSNSLSQVAVIAEKTPRSKSANSIREALGL